MQLREAYTKESSVNKKLSKTKLCKMVQLGGSLDRLLNSLIKFSLTLMKNILTPSLKSVLIQLGLTADG